MNFNIFYDNIYCKKLTELVLLYQTNPIFPFKEMGIDPDNLVKGVHDARDIYQFLKKVNFIYYCDQSYIGCVEIDGSQFIIKVDDEANISIIGDDEFNWVKLLIEDDEYLDFKKFCFTHYNVIISDPDYDKFGDIESNYSFFL